MAIEYGVKTKLHVGIPLSMLEVCGVELVKDPEEVALLTLQHLGD